MRIEEHLWETADGRLVKTGDPAATVLKYAAGDEISDDEAREAGLLKQAEKPRDKQSDPPANKGGQRAAKRG